MPHDWIGRIDFDPATAAKINVKHNLTEDQIREAVSFGHSESAVFNDSTPYGPRLQVIGTTADGTRVEAWLRPVDRTDGHWECMTAVRP